MKDFSRKITGLEKLLTLLTTLKATGKKIALCHGTFDLVHRAHVHQFEQACKLADILVVSVTTDAYVFKGPGRPVFNQDIRAEMVAVLELVDFVVLNDAPNATDLITNIRPDFYVKGAANADRKLDTSTGMGLEYQAILATGGTMHFTQEIPIHSTPLLRNYINPYTPDTLKYLEDLRTRYPVADIDQLLGKLKELKVLIIGEAIIDQYDYVTPMDLSLKGGVITTRLHDSEFFGGGSVACANHVAGFCSQVTLVTGLGSQNSYEGFIRTSLAPNVELKFLVQNGRSTTVKQRQVDQTYFRKRSETYLFDDTPLNESEEGQLLAILDNLKEYDLVIATDYGHGLITEKIVNFLSENSRFLAVNTQTNSANRGFHVITRYPRANYINIDSYETRVAFRDKCSSFKDLALRLKQDLRAEMVSITLGHNGSLITNGGQIFLTPALSRNVVDPTGAGNVHLSLSSLAVRAGWPTELVGFIGNAAGALAVTWIGNKASVSKNMLMTFINSLLG